MVNTQENTEGANTTELEAATVAGDEGAEAAASGPATPVEPEALIDTETPAEPETKTFADGLPLVLPLSNMSPEERFRATTRLIFLAPDVPPVQPMPRRNELRKLDDILDSRFPGNDSRERDRAPRERHDRDTERGDRDSDRGDRNGRDAANRSSSRRRQSVHDHDEEE
nr:hypothetical protein [Leucobacter sp.]